MLLLSLIFWLVYQLGVSLVFVLIGNFSENKQSLKSGFGKRMIRCCRRLIEHRRKKSFVIPLDLSMSSVGPKTVKKDNKAKRRRRQLKEHNADGLQAEPTTVKRTRINWSTDDRMANAVEEWDNDRPYLSEQQAH